MSYALRALVRIGVVAVLSRHAIADGVVAQKNLSLGMAKAIAEATLAACKEKGYSTAAAVVDGSSGSCQELDDACAKAGVAKVADQLK